jgi:hypothetical protein
MEQPTEDKFLHFLWSPETLFSRLPVEVTASIGSCGNDDS